MTMQRVRGSFVSGLHIDPYSSPSLPPLPFSHKSEGRVCHSQSQRLSVSATGWAAGLNREWEWKKQEGGKECQQKKKKKKYLPFLYMECARVSTLSCHKDAPFCYRIEDSTWVLAMSTCSHYHLYCHFVTAILIIKNKNKQKKAEKRLWLFL